MVVIVIIGIAATAVVMAVPDTGGSIQAEAERFAARAKAARDSAIVEARPYALVVDPSGYAVSRRSEGRWVQAARHAWVRGTEAESAGNDRGRVRFDSTGMADPLYLTLRRGGRQAAVRIGQDGEIHVQR
jgi:general secretion pathway protein H